MFILLNPNAMPTISKPDLIDAAEKGLYDKGIREKAIVVYFERKLRECGGIADQAVKETSIRFGTCERTIYTYIKNHRS